MNSPKGAFAESHAYAGIHSKVQNPRTGQPKSAGASGSEEDLQRLLPNRLPWSIRQRGGVVGSSASMLIEPAARETRILYAGNIYPGLTSGSRKRTERYVRNHRRIRRHGLRVRLAHAGARRPQGA